MSYRLNKKNQAVQIYPIGDIHVGSSNFNKDYFEYMLEKFKKASDKKIIYLLGDLCECASKRVGASAYNQVMKPDEQIEYIIDSLKPFKKYIRGCVIGNHEARLRKEFDFDFMKIISSALGVQYGNEIYDTFEINKQPYTVYGNHGTKTSQQQHLMMGVVERQTSHIDANLYLYGHAHYSNSWSKLVKDNNGYKRKHYCLTGHYLDYEGSYAEEMMLKPSLPSFSTIAIDSNLRTTITQHNIDEVCI